MHDIQDLIAAMDTAGRIAITTHIRPDGDAIGSALGLLRILSAAGKTAGLVALDPVPRRYAFLLDPGGGETPGEGSPADFDVLIVLDTGAPDRLTPAGREWLSCLPSANLDHHPTNTRFAGINHVDPSASSTGELVIRLAATAGYLIPARAAEALWVAMVTDTGRFGFENTTPDALRAAAVLLETGIAPERITRAVYENVPAARIRLHGRAIERLELHQGGRVALVALTREDFETLGCTGEDADEIVTLPRGIEGVTVALFLYELPGGDPRTPIETKVSIRAAAPFDAAAFCGVFGGGGHARAAGCTLPLPLDAARERVLSELAKPGHRP